MMMFASPSWTMEMGGSFGPYDRTVAADIHTRESEC